MSTPFFNSSLYTRPSIYNPIVLTIFISLYTISPQYLYLIGPINIINAISVIFVIYFIIQSNFTIVKTFTFCKFFWIYMIVYISLEIFHSDLLKSGSYAISFLGVAFCITNVVNSEKLFLRCIDILIVTGVINANLGLIEMASGYNLFQHFAPMDYTFFHDIRLGILRVMTTFGQPISYCVFQGIAGILVIYRLTFQDISNRKVWLQLSYVVIVISMFFSVSRAATVIFLSAHFILFLLSSNRVINETLIQYFICLAFVISCVFLFNDKLSEYVKDIFIMFLSIFSLENSTNYSKEFGGNISGVGDRLSLYKWVYDSLAGNHLLGLGADSKFSYKVSLYRVKDSIEIHYLYIYYKHGLVGLVSLLLSYIGIILNSVRRRNIKWLSTETNIGFNTVIFIFMFFYLIMMFSTQETDITRVYTILISLFVSYNSYGIKFNKS